MIYIFKGCGECCKSIGKVCDECSKACGECCAPLCKVLDRPLGGYAFGTGLMNICCALLAVGGLVSLPDDGSCEETKSMASLFAILNVAISIVHTAFALYLQHKLVKGLLAAGGIQSGSNAKQMMKQAGEIVLYDVGFCLYVFFFIGAFCLQNWAFSVLAGCPGGTGLLWGSATVQYLFCMGAVCFAFCWYCAMACDGVFGATGRRQPFSTGQGRPPQQQPQQPSGLTRIIFGSQQQSTFATGGAPAWAGGQRGTPVVMGVPANPGYQAGGYVQPQPAGGPAQVRPSGAMPSQPPPASGGGGAGMGAQVAVGALSMAGKGLQSAGRWLGGGQSASAQGAAGRPGAAARAGSE